MGEGGEAPLTGKEQHYIVTFTPQLWIRLNIMYAPSFSSGIIINVRPPSLQLNAEIAPSLLCLVRETENCFVIVGI